MKIIILCIFAIAVTSVLANGCRPECQQHEAPNKNVCAPSCGHIDAPINPRIPPAQVPNIRLPYELPNVRFPCGQVPFYPDHDRPHYPSDPHAFKTECNLERKYNHCECEKHEGEEEDDDDVDVCICKKDKKLDKDNVNESRVFRRKHRSDDDCDFDREDRFECIRERRGDKRRERREDRVYRGENIEHIPIHKI